MVGWDVDCFGSMWWRCVALSSLVVPRTTCCILLKTGVVGHAGLVLAPVLILEGVVAHRFSAPIFYGFDLGRAAPRITLVAHLYRPETQGMYNASQ